MVDRISIPIPPNRAHVIIVEDLKRGPNTEIGQKDYFEMGYSNQSASPSTPGILDSSSPLTGSTLLEIT